MKTLIKYVLDNLDQDIMEDPQFHWEHLKYKIRKFYIHFSKDIAWNMKTERTYLENILKTLETTNHLTLNIPKLNLLRSTKKKQMVLELEENVTGTCTEKNLQIFAKFWKIKFEIS